MTPEKFQELSAQREGDKLDFKREMYHWGVTKKERREVNAELAKDIMAMANLIPVGGSSSYILIGVKERQSDKTGEVIGIPEGNHPDDADLQQKVKGILNRVPKIQYHQFDVEDYDGNEVSVGALEVIGGERPYFPLRDQGVLQRHVARVRAGSSTDVASPTQIQEWVAQDNPAARELERIELEKARAENSPLPVVSGITPHQQGSDIGVSYNLTNKGMTPFTLQGCDLRILLDEPAPYCEEHYDVDIEAWDGDLTVFTWTVAPDDDPIPVHPDQDASNVLRYRSGPPQGFGIRDGLTLLREGLVAKGFPADKDLSLQFKFEVDFRCRSYAGIEKTISASDIEGWILRCPVA